MATKAFEVYHRAFHGTSIECIRPILEEGMLLLPGWGRFLMHKVTIVAIIVIIIITLRQPLVTTLLSSFSSRRLGFKTPYLQKCFSADTMF